MAKKKKNPATHKVDCTQSGVYSSIVDVEEIKRRRDRKGLTQLQAAKLAGWPTQQQWASVESGTRPNPTIETLAAVAKVLGCKVDDLLTK